LLPALRATSADVSPVLREEATQTTTRSRARGILIGAQVALCTVLLACSTLFLHSLVNARVIDPDVQDESTAAIRAFNQRIHTDERVWLTLVPIGDGLMLAQKKS